MRDGLIRRTRLFLVTASDTPAAIEERWDRLEVRAFLDEVDAHIESARRLLELTSERAGP